MPWKETHKMELRMEFALRSLQASDFSALCREYGISRKTGYKWKNRFLAHGAGGLAEKSRRPLNNPNQISAEVACELVKIKHDHMSWGPEKILAIWQRHYVASRPPSLSTVKRVLEAAGLTKKRRKRRVKSGRLTTGRKAENPNDVWTVDFKGWWRDHDGLKIEPLTIRDESSRKILDIRILENTRTESVKVAFERLFECYGLPEAIRSDNGAPFACSRSLMGLSRLSAWWLALGIDLERGRPGHPQDNGAHERMHRDIRRDLESQRVGRDQAVYDAWREEFNSIRPHKSLNNKTPDEFYETSRRSFEGTPEELDYGPMDVRKVTRKNGGTIKYQRARYRLSETIGGWTVGLKAAPDSELTEIWFAKLFLGYINDSTESFIPADQLKTNESKATK